MSLVKEIIKDLLPENKQDLSKVKTTAIYAGGFKPPTAGHFAVVKQALLQHPEIDEFIIYIGNKTRDGIDQNQSLLIWDIYKNYLSIKVVLEPTSKPPIQAVYNYAKDNPDEEVIWIIGAREGNEEDFKDISKRTTSLDKYPNLELDVTITASGASGTAARNASKISLEKLKPLLPKVLTDQEYKDIFNLLDPNLKENEPPLLKEILDPANFDFKPIIKSLTKSMEEDGLKLKPYPKVIFKHNEESNSEDFFGKTAYYDPSNNEVVLYTLGRHPKDIMRSYAHELIHVHQNHEDRLEGIGTDNVNEDDYLEKIEREAYENGNIMFRSWTNKTVNESKGKAAPYGSGYKKVKETVSKNKILCDNCGWSWNIKDGGDDLYICHDCGHDNEPIQEKKTKDPFGLNAFAHELAQLNEEEDNYQIYCDMDGVLTDFESGYEKLTGVDLKGEFQKGSDFWDPISKAGVGFWAGLQWMPGGKELWAYLKPFNPVLLSAPSREESSRIGKAVWVKHKIPGTKLILRYAKQKQQLATPESILIDDRQINIDQWEAAGGIGILHTSTSNTIEQLKKLGL
jgi:hypothetical protein|tara:strand:- start:1903 stop:3609 length:1707 start_codon:yes stop_codon:yes gene_type:complete